MKAIFRACLISILIMSLFINIVYADNGAIYKISGQSMSPTIADSDYVSVTAKDNYAENDIVVAKDKLSQDYIIKRIKGEYLIGDNKEHSAILRLSDTDIVGAVDIIFDNTKLDDNLDIDIAKALDPLDPSLAVTISTNINSISSLFKINDRYFIIGTNSSNQYCLYEILTSNYSVALRYNFTTQVSSDVTSVSSPILVAGKYKFWITCKYSSESISSCSYRNSRAVVSTSNFTSFTKEATGLFSHNGSNAKIYSAKINESNGYYFATVVKGTNYPIVYSYTSSYNCKTGSSSEREKVKHEFDIDSVEIYRSTNYSTWSRVWHDSDNPEDDLWQQCYYGGIGSDLKILDPVRNSFLLTLTKETDDKEEDKWSNDYNSEWNSEISLVYGIHNGVTYDYDVYEYIEQKDGYDICDKPSPLPSMEKEGELVNNSYRFSNSAAYIRVYDYRMMYDYKDKYGPIIRYKDYYYYVNGKYVDSDFESYNTSNGKYDWSNDPIKEYMLFADMTSLYYDDYESGDTNFRIYYSNTSACRALLLTINNYSGKEYYKSADNTQIYFKANLTTGTSNYYRIKDGSCTTITESTYNANKPIPPVVPPLPPALVTPDNLYSEIGYYKYYADNLYAIFYNATEKKLKIAIGNSIPVIEVLSPTADETFGAQHTAVIPQITVSDPDNNTLTCKYYIDGTEKETKIATNTVSAQTVSFSAVNIGALSEDAHKMKFEVSDGLLITEETIDFIVDKTPPTITKFNIISTANSMTIEGAASDDAAGMGDEIYPPYRYTITDGVNTWQSDWKTQTTHTQSSLHPNRNYTIKLEARDKVGNIKDSTITAYTKAEVPTITTDNITTNTMDIQIDDNNPANTKYSIAAGTKYVSSGGALTTTPQWITLTNKRIKATGLTPNTSYIITAKARNGAGEATLASAEAKGMTLPTAPENITAQPDKYFITLTWSAMPYITKYEVSADGEIESTGTETTYIHDDLIPNTQHSYKVRAVNAGGDGLWSDILTATTLPDPPGIPINLRAEASQNEITLEWDAVEGAIDYDVEADGNLEENITGITYIHSGLLSNTPHTYRVRARNRGGVGEWSDLLNKDTLPDPPGIPEGIEVTETTKDTITLTWNAADRAEGYDIEARGAIIDSTTDTTYTHIGLDADTEYTYRIRARNIGGESEWTEETIARTLPEKPSIPNNLTATAGTNEISLSWDNAERAAEYDVEADGELIATITGTSYIHEGLAPDTQHTYRVKSKNTGGESDFSVEVTAYTLSETTGMALTNVAAVVTNTSITLMWDAVAADTEYDVEVDGEIKDNEKNTTYIHSALQPVTSHTYKIRPKRGEEKGPWCAVLAISTLPNPPDAPDNIRAKVTNTTIQLMWDEEEGATGYDIEIDGNDVVSTTGTMYIHEDLIPGTQHSYRIRAVNIAGATPWSQAIEKSTIKPTYMIEAEAGEEYHIALAAMGMQEFKGRKLVLEYNPVEVEILDLCEETRGIELENGRIPGTNIIINHTAGRIEIEADKSIEPGKAWTGVLSTILIRSKVDGLINLDYLAE